MENIKPPAQASDEQPPFDEQAALSEQLTTWRAEVARLNDLIAHASGVQASDEPMRANIELVIARLEQIAGNFTDDTRNAAEEALVYTRAALKAQPAPTEAQGEPLDMKLPCDVVIGNMTIRKGVRLGTLVGKAQRDHARLMALLPSPSPEQVVAFNTLVVKSPETDAKPAETRMDSGAPAGGGIAAQGEDSARLEWKRITGPGQVKVGDKLRFTIGDVLFNQRVKQIINPGYPDEELIYNKRRNFYVITSNAITNFGSSKNVEYLARASAETGGVKS